MMLKNMFAALQTVPAESVKQQHQAPVWLEDKADTKRFLHN
jgi:hypothetical protein